MSSVLPTSSLSQKIGICGYIVTFVLGLIGHLCSLLTFSQHQLRSTSTGLFFLSITIFDMFYLLMSLYDFLFINLNLPQLSPYYISLCRFRTFIINFVQTTAAWLLVCITFDRWIRTRLPYRVKQWCIKKNVIRALFITILCSVAFNSHVLQRSFTTAYPFSRVICGPSRVNVTEYTIFYYFTWSALQISVNILVPALLMIVCLIDIYRKVRNVALVRQNQMFLLMLSKTILFLVCTLPYGTYRMLTIDSLDMTKTTEFYIFLIVTAFLTILLDANYSIAFYIHCLTSTLFRQIFFKTIKNYLRRRQPTIQPAVSIVELAR